MDVPRRLGRSAILSASAKAFSSAVTAVYTGKTVFQALKDYGAALTCMRNAFASDPGQAAKADTLCGIYLLLLSQITESIIDPRVIISDLKLDLKQTNFYGPVNDYSVVDIRSTNLTVANLIVLPTYLREPEHHLGRLRASYDLMRLESKKLVSITVQLHAACEASNDWAYYKGYVICESTVSVLHCLMALIRRTLEIFHPQDAVLQEHADHAANEVLAAGRRAWSFRPLGTTYMPKTLCLMWATVDNPNTKARLENMIDSYRENFRGNSWTKLVHFFEQRFEAMRRRAQSRIPYRFRLDTASPGSTNAGSEESV
ncbi:hypothetical protein UVI_02023670 [Ustilaginoidea virens]|uniref:Uncharacterized protein n=1 Tax=Ustilaginoidea virens TaxID=1159556 RepID=A0A1B5L0N8_USTVR|nr:hypothetical protein UVI_02023670 [Ustilaginoidea virens]